MMSKATDKTRLLQAHNQVMLDNYHKFGEVRLGPYASYTWRRDPQHLLFSLARYKFCGKMLAGKSNVLEIGCGDAFGISIVLQTVDRIHGIDIEPLIIEDNLKRSEYAHRCSFEVLDITKNSVNRKFDGAFSLDVIEHISPPMEHRFIKNIYDSLRPHAVFIIGTPNITAHQYASPNSVAGHINLKSYDKISKLLKSYFHNVFLFSMNDEVIHTGYYPMGHYLFGVGVGVK